MSDQQQAEVIVVGAGPTGRLLAGDRAEAGVEVIVLEKRGEQLSNLSRAFAVHARTLEVLDARRLTDKLPPRLPAAPTPGPAAPDPHPLLVECAECGRPGPADALPDGLCRPCRATVQAGGVAAPGDVGGVFGERDVHALVAGMRNLMRTP